MFSDYEYEYQLYKETLQELQHVISKWRNDTGDQDDFDYLYEIETIDRDWETLFHILYF